MPDSIKTQVEVTNSDDSKLAELGYKPELRRQYSPLALAGVAVVVCNSWGAVGGALITGLANGGPPTIIFGWLLVTIMALFTALSLGELASAYPTSAGAYNWVARLSPKKLAAPLSYITGLLNLAAWIFGTTSAGLFLAQCVMALASLANNDLVIERWMTFVVFEAFVVVAFIMATIGDRLMPFVARAGLAWTATGCFVSAIVVLAKSSPKASAKQVFATFINQTGWSSNGIAACIGLINPAFGFSGFDAAVHFAEEVRHPSMAIPRALLAVVGVNCITCLFFIISLFFSVTNYEAVLTTNTGLPIAEMYRQAGGQAVGIGLLLVVFFAGVPAFFDIFIATVRLNWALARDNALPFSKTWAKVNEKLGIPLWSTVLTAVIQLLLALIYIGNTTAFSAILSSSMVLNNLTFIVPVLVNMCQGRRAAKLGDFRLGKALGWTSNIVMCGWTLFTLIFFEFPFVLPVNKVTMNYTVVVLSSTVILGGAWYAARARKYYTGPPEELQGVESMSNVDVQGFPVESKA
ncbi:hypothetical protein LTS17_006769 [Exophiala oligosperma]